MREESFLRIVSFLHNVRSYSIRFSFRMSLVNRFFRYFGFVKCDQSFRCLFLGLIFDFCISFLILLEQSR